MGVTAAIVSLVPQALTPSLVITDDSAPPADQSVTLPQTIITTTSAPAIFTLSNAGPQAISVTNFASGGANAGEFGVVVRDGTGAALVGTAFTIPAGAAYTIEVRLHPMTAGPKSGAITFSTTDPAESAVSLMLNGSATDVVTLPDPAMNAAVRQQLNRPLGPITVADMQTLTVLNITDSGAMENLEGIEFATNLQSLNWQGGGGTLANLSPLSGLSKLTQLSLNAAHIVNLLPLAGLTSLQTLDLTNNDVSNLAPLSGLTNLASLNLNENQVTDIHALAGLTSLLVLDLSNFYYPPSGTGNMVTNLQPLVGLVGLKHLSLNYNQVVNIQPLATLVNLQVLSLDDNLISNINALSSLVNLQSLYLYSNKVAAIPAALSALQQLSYLDMSYNLLTSISPLAPLTRLQSLYLAGNQIDNADSLAALTGLVYLDVSSNKIASIGTLSQLPQLQYVNAGYNQIADSKPLAGLQKLFTLNLNGNHLIDISTLGALPSLQFIDLDSTQLPISSLAALASLPHLAQLTFRYNGVTALGGISAPASLWELDLDGNSIKDISPLESLTQLRTLSLSGNPLGGIAGIANLVNLQTLNLDSTGVADFTPLQRMTQFRSLSAQNNKLTAITGLTGLTGLQTLTLSNNQISDLSGLSNLPQLTYLDLSNNQIVDVTPSSALVSLRTLYLQDNFITVITSLSELTQLTYLNVSLNGIDLSPGSPGAQALAVLQSHAFVISLPQSKIVSIPDPALLALVRQRLNKPTGWITDQAMLGLTSLYIDGTNLPVTDLTGLQYATNLQSLSFSNQKVPDLTPIASLANLTSLSISGGALTDLTPLDGLPKLTQLSVTLINLADLSPFAGLTRLTQLSLTSDQIKDVRPLERLTNLQDLTLDNNNVSDVAPLGTLHSLTTLSLSQNALRDIGPLAALTELQGLNVTDNFLDLSGGSAASGVISTLTADGAAVSDLPQYPTVSPGPITVSIGNGSIIAGPSGSLAMQFTITRAGDLGRAIAVSYATADGTATAGVDYKAVSGSATIPANSATATIAVPVIGDSMALSGKGFLMKILSAVAVGDAPSFAYPQLVGYAGSSSGSFTIGDFNGDELPDIATWDGNGNLQILLNATPRGSHSPVFAPAQDFKVGPSPGVSLTAVDINGDGIDDLVVTGAAPSTFTVLLNTTPKDGASISFAPVSFPITVEPDATYVTDVNGDGLPDLIFGDASGNLAVVLNQTTPGSTVPRFAPAKSFLIGTSSGYGLAIADFNGDGRPDIVGSYNGSSYALLNTTGTGAMTASFDGPTKLVPAIAYDHLAVGDFNGDGRPDLVGIGTYTSNAIAVLLNTTAAGATALSFSTPAVLGSLYSLQSPIVADLNGDGKPDLLVLNGGSSSNCFVLLNTTPNGADTASFTSGESFATPSSNLITADLAADGVQDLIMLRNKAIYVMMNAAPVIDSAQAVGILATPVVVIGDGSAQRSEVRQLTLHFGQAVTFGAGAVTLSLLNTGGSGSNDGSAPTDVSAALGAPSTPDGGFTWVFTFLTSDSSIVDPTGSLRDGVYSLTLHAAGITGSTTAFAGGDRSIIFHRLFGDIDGNGIVNSADYFKFKMAFGSKAGQLTYNPSFDFDANGAINSSDYFKFKANFGKKFTS